MKFRKYQIHSFLLNVYDCLKRAEEDEHTLIGFTDGEISFISDTTVNDCEVDYRVRIKSPYEEAMSDVADILLDICVDDTEVNYIVDKYIFGNNLFQITASHNKIPIRFEV